MWWIDSKNFVEFSRPLYAKLLPFPLNFYYPGQYEKHAKQMMVSLYPEEEDFSVIETAVSLFINWNFEWFVTELIEFLF